MGSRRVSPDRFFLSDVFSDRFGILENNLSVILVPEDICGTANGSMPARISSAVPDWITAARVPS